MAAPHSDILDRSVYHPDRKDAKTNPSIGDSLDRSVSYSTKEQKEKKSCNRSEKRFKRRIPKVQTINENEEETIIYSRFSGNQDFRTKEPINQKCQTTLEHSSDSLSARTKSSHVNPLFRNPDKNPSISIADVYPFSTDPDRNENNRDIFNPKQSVESTSNTIDRVDNKDVWTKPLQQKDQLSLENGSDFLTSISDLNQTTSSDVTPQTANPDIHPSLVSPDLNTTATISAPPASSDVNPPPASPDILPSPGSQDLKKTATISAPPASSDVNPPPASPDIHPSPGSQDLKKTATISAPPASSNVNPPPASPDIHLSPGSQDLNTTATISATPASSDVNPPTASPDIHPSPVSQDLKKTATISAPPASSDVNPPPSSPDKLPTSIGPSIIIVFAAGLIGFFLFKK
ncbi:unnamed protein product [Mytilus edulis]|uniref:Uncharacterized protein n=1 Tax=Mytilus edulis TaxID=6550 RepID=A0A8S3SAY3_MYTED|nr:unnamed protein product [Mytilus edulis]